MPILPRRSIDVKRVGSPPQLDDPRGFPFDRARPLSPALLHLNNLDTAAGGRSESAARAGVANARPESDPAVEKDESQKRAGAVAALLLGHQSRHQRPVRLTTPSGQRQLREPQWPMWTARATPVVLWASGALDRRDRR